ncbi:MAG TPA: hypothetical protein VFF59_13305 [Anaerolineae bacterium]|nr:hypothetical protein [Anaerolineae bacterium]
MKLARRQFLQLTAGAAALADPKIKAHLAVLGSVPMPMSPANFEKMIVAETEKWAKVIRSANIKAE